MSQTIATALLMLAITVVASAQNTSTELQLNKPIERSIAVGETHNYTVRLQQNQVVNLVADQKGADVHLTVFAPDGSKAGEFDSPNGNQGPGPASWLAQSSGSYRIEVSRWPDATNSEGRYEIKLIEVRAATKAELERVRIEREIAEVERRWNTANEQRDLNALKGLAGANYSNFFPFGTFIADKAQFIQYYELNLEKHKNQINKSEITESVTRIMGDLAIVTGRVNITMTENGKAMRYPIRFVHVWSKQSGNWQITGDITYPAEPTRRERNSIKLDPNILESCVGTYVDDSSPDYPLVLTRAGDNLMFSLMEWKDTFYPENDTVFFSKIGTEELLLIFLRNAKGEVTNVEVVEQGHSTMMRKLK